MVKSIFLQDGEEIFVDDEDYERVSQYFWRKQLVRHNFVVVSIIDGQVITLKKFLFGKEDCTQIIKNNDYQRSNFVDFSPTKGSRGYRGSSSIYKGVSWLKDRAMWRAMIRVNGKNKWLGAYKDEWQAAKAYNKAVDDFWCGKGFKNIKDVCNNSDNIPDPIVENLKLKQIRTNTKKGEFRGVYKRVNGRTRVRLNISGKSITVTDRKISKEKAALIYNKVSFYFYGEKAILNDVPMTDELKEFIENWEIPEKIKKLKED